MHKAKKKSSRAIMAGRLNRHSYKSGPTRASRVRAVMKAPRLIVSDKPKSLMERAKNALRRIARRITRGVK